jgi:hypothetical protein
MLVVRIAFVVGLTATLTATASAVATSPGYAGRGTSTRARRAPSPSKKLLAFLARVSGLRQGEGRRDPALRASLPASSLASGCGRIRFGHNPPAVRPRTRTADAPRRLARLLPPRTREVLRGHRPIRNLPESNAATASSGAHANRGEEGQLHRSHAARAAMRRAGIRARCAPTMGRRSGRRAARGLAARAGRRLRRRPPIAWRQRRGLRDARVV